MPRFVIFMREDDGAWSKLPEAEQRRLLTRYREWVGDLKSKGIFQSGEPVARARLLRMVDGRVGVDEFRDTKQTLTGFFVIEAPSWDAAVEVAKGCPALAHGETIELREVGHV
jgi:hypothetical protein